MRRAIREHLRDFIAIGALLFAGLLVTGYILSQQQQPYPSWVPFLGDDRFELKAELSSAQAVIPGQGQTVNIAGVKAGDITDVQLENGRAVVTMLVEAKYADVIHDNASVQISVNSLMHTCGWATAGGSIGSSGEPGLVHTRTHRRRPGCRPAGAQGGPFVAGA